jgi:hypothetical protein
MDFFKKVNKKAGSLAPLKKFYDPYEESDGFLKKVRKEVILPGVTKYEEARLSKIHKYIEEKTGKPSTLPQHMLNDVYSMYVNRDIKKKPVTKYNAIKQKVIDSTYNSLTKMVAKDSVLFSQIVTREISLYMQQVQDLIEEETKDEDGNKSGVPGLDQEGEDPDGGEGQGQGQGQGGDGSDGEGEGDSQGTGDPAGGTGAGKGPSSGSPAPKGFEKKVDDIIKQSQNKLDQAMKNAEKEIKEIEDLLGKDAAKELSDTDSNFLEDFNRLKALLKKVTFNKDNIKTVLMKILNKSQNYFSKNAVTIEESIFDADELDELFGLEYLHPIFRNAGIMDIGNEGKLYTGKIDLYLDCSGSMSSTANFSGSNIKMSELVKGIAIILYRMNMIDRLFFFDTGLYEIKNINEFTILSFDRSGGTDFDRVVTQALATKRNSVVITDGEDGVSKYAKNVFWIGIGGTKFQRNDEFKTYRALRQCVTYNPSTSNFDYCK